MKKFVFESRVAELLQVIADYIPADRQISSNTVFLIKSKVYEQLNIDIDIKETKDMIDIVIKDFPDMIGNTI